VPDAPSASSALSLTLAQARRVALAAQGFTDPRPTGRVDRRALARVVGRTGLFQIDSVNVLVRAHYLPMFSRVGPYPVDLLERASAREPRTLFEYWGHEASLLPVQTQPLLRWRMAEAADRAWGSMRSVAADRPALVEALLDQIRLDGPLTAGELERRHHGERVGRKGPWWDWSHVKAAVEFCFWAGTVTTSSRRGFERLYDLTERVLPAQVLAAPTPDRAEAQRRLILLAAASCGVATERDLRDYYRLSVTDGRARVAELVEDGALLPVAVEGWRGPAYALPGLRVPRAVRARALLAPFDPEVWERDRAERLFGFRYRLEIYVPKPKRVHGYYVLPFLLGDSLVARVDLKADRAAGLLLVRAAWAEVGAPAETAVELAAELGSLARWLGLDGLRVEPVGDLAPALRAACR